MKEKVNNQKNEKSIRVKHPIGITLALIIGLIVVISLGTVTFLNSYFQSKDVRLTAEENNLTINSRSASSIEERLNTIRSNVFQLLDLLSVVSGGRSSALSRQAQSFFFERNPDIASIYVLSEDSAETGNASDIRMVNSRFFISNEIDESVQEQFFRDNQDSIRRSCAGETIACNASPLFGRSALCLMIPYKENGRDQTCCVTFSAESLAEILGTGSLNTSFMINDTDELLVHPDSDRIIRGESMKNYPLVREMRNNNQNNDNARQIPYDEIDEATSKKVPYYGAYQKLPLADIVVMTIVPLDSVLEGARTTTKNNVYLTIAILCISIILILFFARFVISRPLRRLSLAAHEIQEGNFNTPIISRLNFERGDEIGVLNRGTRDEQEFLNTFAKFTNQGVAKAIATKSIDFEPHLKDCTIFFSDIRGFTKISDGFKERFKEESAAEIITFLNDYMGRMVNCVTLSHGNIDKFEGDAIMGVWGILREDDLSFEKLPDTDPSKKQLAEEHSRHVKEDAINCIRGIIAMRYALMEYNKAAEKFTKEHANEPRARYKPHIQIGCGINTGRVTAGVMGGGEKMEYTAIGDAVNFASRTEATNKPCGTDILITEDTYNLIKKDYIRCDENHRLIPNEFAADEIVVERIPVTIEVKGKGEQHFYGVVNMPRFDIEKFFKTSNPDFKVDPDCAKAVGPTGPRTMKEVRELLGIPTPDFEKVNLNEEENKTVVKPS
ncbi:MAG: HAMP domain-containing protein [Treponema sp.]|nr:HAMP domain-containing protein [Treponema sp.]